MTARQTIELKRLEIQKRLGTIAGLQGDDLTTEIEAERDELMVEMRSSIGQLEAAIVAEAAETRGASAVERLERFPRSVEYRGLVERSKLSAYVLESHRQGGLDGAESELRAAVFGDKIEAWTRALGGASAEGQDRQSIRGKSGRQHERHGRTPAGRQETILGRIFRRFTAASFLGVREWLSSLVGVSAHPVITAGVTPTQTAKGCQEGSRGRDGEHYDPRAPEIDGPLLVRSRGSSKRVDGLEEALRLDLAGALAESMDWASNSWGRRRPQTCRGFLYRDRRGGTCRAKRLAIQLCADRRCLLASMVGPPGTFPRFGQSPALIRIKWLQSLVATGKRSRSRRTT